MSCFSIYFRESFESIKPHAAHQKWAIQRHRSKGDFSVEQQQLRVKIAAKEQTARVVFHIRAEMWAVLLQFNSGPQASVFSKVRPK